MAADPPTRSARSRRRRGVTLSLLRKLTPLEVPRALLDRGAPRPEEALRRYRARAASYDAWTSAGQAYRDATVSRLELPPGAVVLDVGCGTGLNFAALEDRIGPSGQLIGIDLSPEMLAQARARIERHGWGNVTLIEATVQDALIPLIADAALLCGVHDVLRSPSALANVIAHVRPGGQIVAGGAKWVPWWRPNSLAFNPYLWFLNRNDVSTFEGFTEPWSHLARLIPDDLEVEETFFGGGFIATGALPEQPGSEHAHAAYSSQQLTPAQRPSSSTSGAIGRSP
jgi:SAM-dependent methyltransferase